MKTVILEKQKTPGGRWRSWQSQETQEKYLLLQMQFFKLLSEGAVREDKLRKFLLCPLTYSPATSLPPPVMHSPFGELIELPKPAHDSQRKKKKKKKQVALMSE